METIVLEIDDKSAKAWNNSSPLARASYESKIVALVKEFQEAEQIDEDDFLKPQRDFLAKEAAENFERYEWWNDEEIMAEIDEGEADFRSGKDPGITWDALKAELLSRRKKNAS